MRSPGCFDLALHCARHSVEFSGAGPPQLPHTSWHHDQNSVLCSSFCAAAIAPSGAVSACGVWHVSRQVHGRVSGFSHEHGHALKIVVTSRVPSARLALACRVLLLTASGDPLNAAPYDMHRAIACSFRAVYGRPPVRAASTCWPFNAKHAEPARFGCVNRSLCTPHSYPRIR